MSNTFLPFALLLPLLISIANTAPVNPNAVKKVHLVFSNHYDAGFADYASNILNRYVLGGPGTQGPPHLRNHTIHYNSFLLSAAATANALRNKNTSAGAPRFKYMTQAYIASYFLNCTTEYPRVPLGNPLKCPNASQLETFTKAIEKGDVFWHAFPHNAEPELMDASFLEYGIQFAVQLAAEYKAPVVPSVFSQRDVPGLSRAAIPTFSANNVIGVSIGINDGSPPPILPSTIPCYSGLRQVRTPFLWKDLQTNTSVIADFHPGGYGGVLPINPDEGVPYYSRDGVLCDCVGLQDLDEVLCYTWKGDNYGGANVTETEDNFAVFHQHFPNAQVLASTMETYWTVLLDHTDKMEVVTSEIGDTWMYGASSDPFKLATMRYMMRARKINLEENQEEENQKDGTQLDEFNRLLLKLPEHTWGSCGSSHMHVTKPTNDWTADDLEAAINRNTDPFFNVVIESWNEQRLFMSKARAAVPLSSALRTALDNEHDVLTAPAPTASSLMKQGYTLQNKKKWSNTFTLSSGLEISFDILTGGLNKFQILSSPSSSWASDTSKMFQFMYRSHSYAEAQAYADIYKYSHGGPFPHVTPNGHPFPGSETLGVAKQWYAPITGIWIKDDSNAIVVQMTMPIEPSHIGYGPPSKIWMIYTVPSSLSSLSSSSIINVEVVWEGKRPTRLRESIWLEVRPTLSTNKEKDDEEVHEEEEWTLFIDKIGQQVNASDVVKQGGAALHGMDPSGGVSLVEQKSGRSLSIVSLDCGLVAPGSNTNIWNITAFDKVPVNAQDGCSFDLYSNLYAVNYPMWYPWLKEDSTSRFRFEVVVV